MTTSLPDASAVMAVFRKNSRGGTRALHVSEVMEELGLAIVQRHAFAEMLDQLAERGLLSRMSGSRYRMPRRAGAFVVGRLSWNARGFGFVAAEDGAGDVFIASQSVAGAMHGDRVEVTVQSGPRGREGVVASVLERRNARIPGTLVRRGSSCWLEPDDLRVRGPIELRLPQEGVTEGLAALVEIVQWPESAGEVPQARLVRVLGRPGQLDVEVEKVLLREAVDESMPADAVAEAQAFGTEVSLSDLARREDLRAIPFLTIDPDDARDHDDAVHVVQNEDGSFVAWVAIADVSHYVQPGTALDRMALERGTSLYLPDRAIPMLPRELSSNLASLLQDVDRLALVARVNVSAIGRIERSEVVEAVIRSHASLTYSNVAWALGWGALGKPAQRAEQYRGDLATAAELATLLRARRMRRGALDLDLPEARVKFAEDGRTPIDVVQSREDAGIRRAYGLIEELMLLANEVVASLSVRKNLPAVFRVHGGPEEKNLLRFCAIARAHGYDVEPEEVSDPKRLSALLRKVKETPFARTLASVLLRSLPQAFYSPENSGHFGLASEAYLHFTSPIRRYPDVVTHRVVRQHLRAERIRRDELALEALGTAAAESSRRERRAMDVEREVMDLYRCVIAREHVGEVHEGVVTSVTPSGPFVQIEQPFVDVLIRVDALSAGEGEWAVDELGMTMVSGRSGRRFTLGDRVTLEIKDVSISRRAVYGVPVGEVDRETTQFTQRERRASAGRSFGGRNREGKSKHGRSRKR